MVVQGLLGLIFSALNFLVFFYLYLPLIALVYKYGGPYKGESAMIDPVFYGILLGILVYGILVGLLAALLTFFKTRKVTIR